MDYQKNLPLPLTGVGQEYFKRQLWIHNFCIHDMANDTATMKLLRRRLKFCLVDIFVCP